MPALRRLGLVDEMQDLSPGSRKGRVDARLDSALSLRRRACCEPTAQAAKVFLVRRSPWCSRCSDHATEEGPQVVFTGAYQQPGPAQHGRASITRTRTRGAVDARRAASNCAAHFCEDCGTFKRGQTCGRPGRRQPSLTRQQKKKVDEDFIEMRVRRIAARASCVLHRDASTTCAAGTFGRHLYILSDASSRRSTGQSRSWVFGITSARSPCWEATEDRLKYLDRITSIRRRGVQERLPQTPRHPRLRATSSYQAIRDSKR